MNLKKFAEGKLPINGPCYIRKKSPVGYKTRSNNTKNYVMTVMVTALAVKKNS